MTFLPDVNVWLALVFEAHAHHRTARAWFDQTTSESAVCRLTQMGFLRLATNPQAFGDEAVTLAEAWRLCDAMLADPRVIVVDEPPGILPLWREFSSRQSFSPKVWNDAYLAAFACNAAYRLVTFDRAMTQYAALLPEVLSISDPP
jgi:uncharacterized protein